MCLAGIGARMRHFISHYNRNSSTSLLEVFFHIHVFFILHKIFKFWKALWYCDIHIHTIFFVSYNYLQSLLKYSFTPFCLGPKRHALYTHLSIFNRENKSWARLLFCCCTNFAQKNFSFFLQTFPGLFSKNSLTRAGPNFEFASKAQQWLQTKYKITRLTRIFTCDMPIAYCDQRRTRF